MMRQPMACDLVRSIKTFTSNYGRRQAPVQEHVEAIRGFMTDMAQRIPEHPMWKGAGREAVEHALEGVEKYVMVTVYNTLFQADTRDVQDDQHLDERIQQLSFVTPQHLGIAEWCRDTSPLAMAVDELRRTDTFLAPRDKMICVHNCCKSVMFMLAAGSSAGTDELQRLLAYAVIRARAPNLVSNLRFIERFRRMDCLQAEAADLANMASAVRYVQALDPVRLAAMRHSPDSPEWVVVPPPTLPASAAAPAAVAAPSPSPPRSPPRVAALCSSAPVRHVSHAPSGPEAVMVCAAPPAASPRATRAPRSGLSQAQCAADGNMAELLAACAEPPVERFLTCSTEDLCMTDIPLLLADYKRMARLCESLTATLKLNVS